MSVGVSRYPSGRVEKQADRRATGPLVARLQGFGNLLCFVAGAWADCSTHLHELIVTCAKSRVAHLCQSTGRLELDGQLGTITVQEAVNLLHCRSAGAVLDLEGRSHVTGGNGCGLGEGLGWANYDLVLGDDKCSCAVASFRYINVCRRDNFHAVNTDC